MKRIWIVIVNIIIMFSMVAFVVIYSTYENKETTKTQIAHFENTTITMEHVTENYLEGEQRICDVWAHYINSEDMTIEEAIDFIRISHVLPNASAHIVFKDTLTGLSTRAKVGTTDDYYVSYNRIDLLKNLSWIHEEIGTSINISRSYTNPINADPSIAFCNFITLKDAKEAILLRVLPVSELKKTWVFPQEEFESAELSIIDAKGDYIIKGHSFKNSSFFDFYKSYNSIELDKASEFFEEITSATGSFTMVNSHKEKCVLAHTPFGAKGGWTLLSMMPRKNLVVNTENWLLIGIVSSGLLVLFIFDLAAMLYFNKRLQVTAKEAESANKAKTSFLSTMSHDIRTPMNAIIGLTTISERNIEDTELVKENLHKISLASNHLLTLINDILDISKVESGKFTLVPQVFSIVDIADNLVNLAQPMVEEKNIEFSLTKSDFTKEYLFADQLRLNQIFINILSNAIKYTEANGRVSVDMKEEESNIPNCIKLIYKVSDNGIGMTPEFMANMYQSFSRQTDSRVNRIQGTGLGLAITKRMVDLMNGVIECESEVGKGTTFTVTLDIPVADEQKVETKVNDNENDYSDLQGLNILVTEDNDINWEIISTLLSMYGITTERAENGRVALEKVSNATKDKYLLVFMDIQMPEMNGLDATRAIRKLDNTWAANIPIIAMTSDAFSENIAECLEAGMNGHIAKPIDINLVIKEIRRIKRELKL